MTTTALPLPTRILIDSSKTVSFSVMSAQFGDGYEQIAPKGINNVRESWAIKWGSVDKTEKDTIVEILNSVGAWGILTWTPCEETVEKKFRVTPDGYSVSWDGKNGSYSVSCSLKQVFDIA